MDETTRSERPAGLWTIAVWLGAIMLTVGVALLLLLPHKAHCIPSGFRTPIIALEFARTQREVRGLVEPLGEDGDSPAMRAFDLGNRVDFGFLLAYGGFLFTAALAASRQGARAARGAACLSLVAAGLDAAENVQLLAITAALREEADPAAALTRLAWATWGKWGSLLLAFLLLCPWLWRQGKVGRTVAMFAVAGAASAMLSPLARGPLLELMGTAVFAMFLGLFVVAVRNRRHPTPDFS